MGVIFFFWGEKENEKKKKKKEKKKKKRKKKKNETPPKKKNVFSPPTRKSKTHPPWNKKKKWKPPPPPHHLPQKMSTPPKKKKTPPPPPPPPPPKKKKNPPHNQTPPPKGKKKAAPPPPQTQGKPTPQKKDRCFPPPPPTKEKKNGPCPSWPEAGRKGEKLSFSLSRRREREANLAAGRFHRCRRSIQEKKELRSHGQVFRKRREKGRNSPQATKRREGGVAIENELNSASYCWKEKKRTGAQMMGQGGKGGKRKEDFWRIEKNVFAEDLFRTPAKKKRSHTHNGRKGKKGEKGGGNTTARRGKRGSIWKKKRGRSPASLREKRKFIMGVEGKRASAAPSNL